MDLLERMNAEGLTLLVVTHDPAIAARSGRVLVMRDGRIERRLPGSALTASAPSAGAGPGTPP
jgi:ABC-type lipoprotein export system ATPase subunit